MEDKPDNFVSMAEARRVAYGRKKQVIELKKENAELREENLKLKNKLRELGIDLSNLESEESSVRSVHLPECPGVLGRPTTSEESEQNNINELLNMMGEESQHVPTVYDCEHCKHNTGLIKGAHCNGCRVLNPNWMNRSRPTKYEPVVLTMTTQSEEELRR